MEHVGSSGVRPVGTIIKPTFLDVENIASERSTGNYRPLQHRAECTESYLRREFIIIIFLLYCYNGSIKCEPSS